MQTEVRKAEWISDRRSAIFYLLAAALIVSALLGFPAHVTGSRSAFWVAACVLAAIHLTPASTALNRSRIVKSLLNDESVRQHRLMCFAAGFWAMIACSVAMSLVATVVPIVAMSAAQLVTSVGLAAALISFATLERRADRT